MDYSKYDPTKPVIFLIGICLGGAIFGPLGNAFINWADLSEETAIGFSGTIFSVTLGAVVVWWRIKASSKQHIEAMEQSNEQHEGTLTAQTKIEIRKHIAANRPKLFNLVNALEHSIQCLTNNQYGNLKHQAFNDCIDIFALADISSTMATQFSSLSNGFDKIRVNEDILPVEQKALDECHLYKENLVNMVSKSKPWPEDDDWFIIE